MILQVGDIGLNANTKRLNYLRSQIIEPFGGGELARTPSPSPLPCEGEGHIS